MAQHCDVNTTFSSNDENTTLSFQLVQSCDWKVLCQLSMNLSIKLEPCGTHWFYKFSARNAEQIIDVFGWPCLKVLSTFRGNSVICNITIDFSTTASEDAQLFGKDPR